MKPILFNTAMVQAILDGRKTTTRRVIKPRYKDDESGFQIVTDYKGNKKVEKIDENGCGLFSDGSERPVNPPYKVGDILYVRETFTPFTREYCDCDECYGCKAQKQGAIYKADFTGSDSKELKWKPSIFMPKEIARIFLKVTNVRVERLQDITNEGALEEGANKRLRCKLGYASKESEEEFNLTQARNTFKLLWNSIVNKKDIYKYGWDANPYVWVIEFERISKEDVNDIRNE